MCSDKAIRLQRQFQHLPEEVFAAFASAEALSRWLAPSDEITLVVERFDFAVEGAYLFHYHLPDGGVASLEGQFLTIDEPHRLSLSWRWLPPDVHAGIDSLVQVTIVADGAGSVLTIDHLQLDGADMPARHAQGWHGALDRLAAHLTAILNGDRG